MENASKAVIIAGGILIGMITISLFYFMFGQISQFKDITDTDYSQEELESFNKGFLAYNKKLMYGSEVISVINKAVDNNRKYEVVDEHDNEYYIDIAVKLKAPLYMRIETYERVENFNKKYTKKNEITKKIFRAGSKTGDLESFKISANYEDIKKYLIEGANMTDEDGNDVKQSTNLTPQYTTPDESRYTITYYPVTEFKRMTFNCTKVGYNKYGRVNYMEFNQYQ